jgi:hypothetical protein
LYIPLEVCAKGQDETSTQRIYHFCSEVLARANWTYLLKGFINALYFLPLLLLNKIVPNIEIKTRSEFASAKRSFTLYYLLACLAWIFFRAKSITEAVLYIKGFLLTGFQFVLCPMK